MVEPGGSGARQAAQALSCGASGTDAVCLRAGLRAAWPASSSSSARICAASMPGVGGAGLADGQRADRHAGRHLHDRQQAVLARQRLAGDRHAEHGQRGEGRGHAGQVRSPPAPAMITLRPRALARLGVVVEALGRAVRGDHLGLVGDAQLIEHVGGALHGRPVGQAAHDDADLGLLEPCYLAPAPVARERAVKERRIALACARAMAVARAAALRVMR